MFTLTGMDLTLTPNVDASMNRFEKFRIIMTFAIDELKDVVMKWSEDTSNEDMNNQIALLMSKLKADGFE